jgi:plasmid stabilization system protein ParE
VWSAALRLLEQTADWTVRDGEGVSRTYMNDPTALDLRDSFERLADYSGGFRHPAQIPRQIQAAQAPI